MNRYAALLVALIVCATRLGCALHELIGHALAAALFGARVTLVEVTLFAGGLTEWEKVNGRPGWIGELVACGGGMLLNLVTGVVAIAGSRRVRSPLSATFLALFGAGSVLLPVAYACIGLYYGEGDPECMLTSHLTRAEYVALRSLPWNGLPLALPFLAAAPIVAAFATRAYVRVQQAWFPRDSWAGRLKVALRTIVPALVIYFLLYHLSNRLFIGQHLVVFDAAQTASQRSAPAVPSLPMIPLVAIALVIGVLHSIVREDRRHSFRPIWSRRSVALYVGVAFACVAVLGVCRQRLIGGKDPPGLDTISRCN